MCVLVTGGSGFIGSAVCRQLVGDQGVAVINVDKLTYAANPKSLDPIVDDPRYAFERADICDRCALEDIFANTGRLLCCISLPKATSTARSLAPRHLSVPMSLERISCSKRRDFIRLACRPISRTISVRSCFDR